MVLRRRLGEQLDATRCIRAIREIRGKNLPLPAPISVICVAVPSTLYPAHLRPFFLSPFVPFVKFVAKTLPADFR